MTLPEYGLDEDYAERFLEAFVSTYPETGPVVSQNTADGTLTVVIAVDAVDPDDAWRRGREVLLKGGQASELNPPEAIEITLSKVAQGETDVLEGRELVPVTS